MISIFESYINLQLLPVLLKHCTVPGYQAMKNLTSLNAYQNSNRSTAHLTWYIELELQKKMVHNRRLLPRCHNAH